MQLHEPLSLSTWARPAVPMQEPMSMSSSMHLATLLHEATPEMHLMHEPMHEVHLATPMHEPVHEAHRAALMHEPVHEGA